MNMNVQVAQRGVITLPKSLREAYIVTLDRQHFLNNSLVPISLPLLIGVPSDFLGWYRNHLT